MNDIVYISGVKVHRVNLAEAVSVIKEFINDENKHQVCVTNVWSVAMMGIDGKLKKINNSSSLVVADGMPIVWVSRIFRSPIPERITGWDIFWNLSKIAEENGYSLFLLGATEKVLEKMRNNLVKKLSKLKVIGTYAPPFKDKFCEEDNQKIRKAINRVKPDILWVGMTAPKQEKWIYQNLDQLDVKVAIGIGAVFDFVAGDVIRAPLWMQKSGLEWFWRLVREPRRLWKRYLIGNTLFVWLVFKELVQIIILKAKAHLVAKQCDTK